MHEERITILCAGNEPTESLKNIRRSRRFVLSIVHQELELCVAEVALLFQELSQRIVIKINYLMISSIL
jgi:flavin reductase (DIM6/NTAB) family NADH-FMN oxidoreductase RutF